MEQIIRGLLWTLAGILALVAGIAAFSYLESFAGVILLLWSLGFAVMFVKRGLRAFVEYWRSRLSEKVELTLETDKNAYVTGETIGVTAGIVGREELDIEEGRVELVYANRYVYKYRSSDSHGHSSYRTREVTEEKVATGVRILEKGTLLAGSYSRHEPVLNVPSSAPPSSDGEITSVSWEIRLTLAVRGAPDVMLKRPATILSSPQSYANWAETPPELDSSGMCEMEFALPSRSFRVGERVEGTLLLNPLDDFEARSLRIELARCENVSRSSGNVLEAVEASVAVEERAWFRSGTSREYPFALEVPPGAGPCLKTEQSSVGWWLRAVVDRELTLDYGLNVLLNVYNGPSPAALRCPKCGTGTEVGARFCTDCGKAIPWQESLVPAPQDARFGASAGRTMTVATSPPRQESGSGEPASLATPPPPGADRSQRKATLIVLAAVAALVLIPFVLFALVFLYVLALA